MFKTMLKMFKTIEKTIGLFLKAKTLFDVFGDEYSFFFRFFRNLCQVCSYGFKCSYGTYKYAFGHSLSIG